VGRGLDVAISPLGVESPREAPCTFAMMVSTTKEPPRHVGTERSPAGSTYYVIRIIRNLFMASNSSQATSSRHEAGVDYPRDRQMDGIICTIRCTRTFFLGE
jgi:hypothetical protein